MSNRSAAALGNNIDDCINAVEDSDDQLFLSPNFDPLNDENYSSWPPVLVSDQQEIVIEPSAAAWADNVDDINGDNNYHYSEAAGVVEQQNDLIPLQDTDQAAAVVDKGLKLMKIGKHNTKAKRSTKRNSRSIIRNECNINVVKGQADTAEEAAGPSVSSSDVAKKLDHNAKERIRRMKLNASYLALRDLLPSEHSRRSKKLRGAPAIVDKVLQYIPELEDGIEALRLKKETIVQSAAKKKKSDDQSPSSSCSQHDQTHHTVSINKLNQGEVIFQICMSKHDDGDRQDGLSAFANLLQRLEEDGSIICIKSASTNVVCESRICFHLHVQVSKESASEADHIEVLREKVISWLR